MYPVLFYVPYVLVAPAVAEASRPRPCQLFLLRSFLSGLLRCSLLFRRRLLGLCCRLVFFGRCLHLLRLGFFLRQIGSFEALSAKGDLGNAHGREVLPVPAQLLVLLLALVMEDQDLRAAAFFNDLADHARTRSIVDLAFFARNCEHGKLHQAIGAGARLLHSNYVAGRHPVLLATGADNRVHTSSMKCRLKSSSYANSRKEAATKPRAHTGAPKGPADFLLAVFSAPAPWRSRQASPERV